VRAPPDIKPIKRRPKKEKEEKKEAKAASADRYKGLTIKNVLKKVIDKNGKHKLAMEYFEIFAGKVIKQKEFTKVSKELLIQIVKSDLLNVKEADLFESVIVWGKAEATNQKLDGSKPEDLKKVLADILPHIRFPLMTTTDLATVVTQSGLLDSDQILDLFTFLGLKSTDKKATPAKSLKAFNFKERKARKQPSWFKWDNNKKHSNLTLTDEGMTAISSTTSYYHPVFGDAEVTEGVWEYEIVLSQFYQSSYAVTVGFVPSGSTSWTTSGMIGYTGHVQGWAMDLGNGQKYNGTTTASYGATCSSGQTVRVKLDLDKKNLEFFVNETSQGVAFTDLSGPLRPAMSLYGSNTVKLQFPK